MNTEPLPRIPSPPGTWWREFRINALPFFMFAAVAVAAAMIWRTELASPTAIGEVEAVHAEVMTTLDGVVAELRVQPFQRVRAGDPVAVLNLVEGDAFKSTLARLEGNLKIQRSQLTQTQVRNDQAFQRLRLDLLDQKVSLATARVNLQYAESNLARVKTLFEEKIESESIFEQARTARDALLSEVAERRALVAEMEMTLGTLQPAAAAPQNPLVQDAIAEAEILLRQAEKPIVLRAPIDGVVSAINRRPGEHVMAGGSIMTVSASESEHIIGFLRQPLTFQPRVGMAVKVRARAAARPVAWSTILQIGAEVQLVSAGARLPGADMSQERGLPFLLKLPPELRLRPGEIVDLILVSDPN